MSFKNIAGQDSVVEFLRRSIERGTLANSYIFVGAKGTGRFMTALELAKAVNCVEEKADGCDLCPTCKRIDSKNHMDLIIIARGEDGQGEVKIDMVRQLRYLINLKPYEMRKKVCIIDGADAMNQEASNALLKTLEEPPLDSIIILIVENLSNMLPTIQSRCQQVRFNSLPIREAMKTASNQVGHEFDISQPGWKKKEDAIQKKNRIIDALASGRLFDEENSLISKEDSGQVLDIILSWYRDIIMARINADESLFMNFDRIDAIRKEASKSDVEIEGLISLAEEVINSRFYLERNVNFKLVWAALGQKLRYQPGWFMSNS